MLQSFIAKSVSDLDLGKAAEMAGSIPPEFRASAVAMVAGKLVDKGKLDDAIELLNLSSGTKYPFSAAEKILNASKDDDPRRAILFGGALSGHQSSPDREFGQ